MKFIVSHIPLFIADANRGAPAQLFRSISVCCRENSTIWCCGSQLSLRWCCDLVEGPLSKLRQAKPWITKKKYSLARKEKKASCKLSFGVQILHFASPIPKFDSSPSLNINRSILNGVSLHLPSSACECWQYRAILPCLRWSLLSLPPSTETREPIRYLASINRDVRIGHENTER